LAVYASYLEDFVASRGALQLAWKGWLELQSSRRFDPGRAVRRVYRKRFPKAVSVIEASIH
jgi:hypothetical protein